MADSKAIRAGRAFVELFADDGPLQPGLKVAERKLATWGKTMTTAGLAIIASDGAKVAAGIAAAFQFAAAGENLHNLAAATAVSVEELSALEYAANHVGASIEDVGSAFSSLGGFMMEAKQGSGQALELLNRLGVTFGELERMSPADAFKVLSDGIVRLRGSYSQAQAAQQLFGSGSERLMPLIRGGSAEINRLGGHLRDIGGVMSGEDAAAGKEFMTVWRDIRIELTKIVQAVGSALLPTLKSILDYFVRSLPPILAWVKENKGIIVAAFGAAAAFVALGVALVALGTVFSVLSAAIGLFSGLLGFLVSPGGMLIVGAAAVLYFSNAFDNLGSTFTTAWEGIKAALASGDIELALEIAGKGLEIAWRQILKNLSNAWDRFTTSLEREFSNTTDDFATFLNSLPGIGQLLRGGQGEDAVQRELHRMRVQENVARANALAARQAAPDPEIERLRAELNQLRDRAVNGAGGGGGLPWFQDFAGRGLAQLRAGAGQAATLRDALAGGRQVSEATGTFSALAASAVAGGESPMVGQQRRTNEILLDVLFAVRNTPELRFSGGREFD